MLVKKVEDSEIYIISSNYDYSNPDNLNKSNIDSAGFLDDMPNNSIVVLQDSNLGGYMAFLESIEKVNKKYPERNLKPVISLKVQDGEDIKTYYAKNKDEVGKLLSINNPLVDNQVPIENLNLENEITPDNILLFQMNNLYSDILKVQTGYFSPKYSGQYEPLLNPANNFSEVRKYLETRVKDKLDIDIEKNPEYRKRINEEIDVLSGGNFMKQNFLEYMFVVSDMVSISKKNDISVGPGRGSGAGSLTAYLLDITEVDPIIDNLSFERFLNKDRPSFPDFDIDFDSSKLNSVKSLIQELGYSIIQIGTLNSHSHNDFLPKVKTLEFLSEEEKNKLYFSIKNDFDTLEKEDILKDPEDYIFKKLNSIGYDVRACFNSINIDINKKLNNLSYFYDNGEQINSLKNLTSTDYQAILKKLASNTEYKNIFTKIGWDKLDFNTSKTALMKAVELKSHLVDLVVSGSFDKKLLTELDLEFQREVFGGEIKGKFFDYLVSAKRSDILDEDFTFENIKNVADNASLADLGDFLNYKDFLEANFNGKNYDELHNKFLEKRNENTVIFFNNIKKYIDREIDTGKKLNGVLEHIRAIKVSQKRDLDKTFKILDEVCNKNGLVNTFTQNFETYKGLGAHASGHIIVSKEQFQDMLKVFPVLQQKTEKGKKSRDPVMGVNHKYVEKFGGVKFDLLGLKTLTIYEIAKKMGDVKINPSLWERGNPACEKIINFLSEDRDFGFIFQAEGVEIKTALNLIGTRLKEHHDMKLVDAISNVIALARPGPIANGTLYDFLSGGKKTVENFNTSNIQGSEILDLRDKISKALKGTDGYLVYQEQIIDIAKIMGLSGGEADNFRRAISKKDVELLKEQEKIFIEKGLVLCGDSNNTDGNKKYLESVFQNLASFAEYGFNKSHSMAYAYLLLEGAHLAVEHPKEFVASNFIVYGGEVGTLDGNSDNKEVLKSNQKIEPLMAFAGSLNVPIKSYWDSENINLIDVNKDTDKDFKKMTHLNENGEVVLSSKILNSKNQEKIDHKKCWAIGKGVGSGKVVDISSLRYSNQKNYLLKHNNEDCNIKTVATFLKIGQNGRYELTAGIDNDKKYPMFLDRSLKPDTSLKQGDTLLLDVLISTSKDGKVLSNVKSVEKLESSFFENIYNEAHRKEVIEIKESQLTLNKKAIDEILFD